MDLAAHLIVTAISHLGYAGIVLLMAIESACVPLPSEIVLPFSGYLAATGRFDLAGVALAGALGCNLGSAVAYAVGYYGGRPLALRYGRRVWLSPADLIKGEAWVRRRGNLALFVGRILPIVRTFIALPAGVVRMRLLPFHLITFLGSLLWCAVLAWVGFRLGQRWTTVGPLFHRFNLALAVLLACALGAAIWHHAQAYRSGSRAAAGDR